jgi:two-component sensor histidine kinase/two-component SAPR family response regulator
MEPEKVNILLVDDQPGKLASYEVILGELGQNLLKAGSAKQALELLLKNDVAVILVDVCMPELDGFELAQMIREHPRFRETAIIFISAVLLSELDSLRAYEMGAVDYMSVPVVPGVLRAKVRVFVDLYRKTRELARINNELESRVKQRTSELEAAIAQQELLAREVDHRARNSLAVIQSIVTMMPATSGDLFAKTIEGRIRAMARAHTLMSQSRWDGADLQKLVNEELEPYRSGGRVHVHGAAVAIKPSVAQNFALAIHELATNAAKYGALSIPEGRLNVSWTLTPDKLVVDWREIGGPASSAPTRRGFGSKVIDASIKNQLGGEISYDWSSGNLHCHLRVPAGHFAPPAALSRHAEEEDEEDEAVEAPRTRELPASGRKVLLVEDEPLVAMMMTQMIADLGGEVIGPFGTLGEALDGLPDAIDAALLDVNVGGEFVYPLADRLAARGTPITFLTGYDSRSIDTRFAGSSVLTKPIDEPDLVNALNASFADGSKVSLAG